MIQSKTETSSQNMLQTGGESRKVNHDPEQQNAENSSQNMLLTGEEESPQEGEIIVLDIVPPTPKKNMKNKKTRLLDAEKKKIIDMLQWRR